MRLMINIPKQIMLRLQVCSIAHQYEFALRSTQFYFNDFLAYRFIRDKRGATAVEFGLVAIPFFTMFAAIIQISFQVWAAQNLDYAVQKASRARF